VGEGNEGKELNEKGEGHPGGRGNGRDFGEADHAASEDQPKNAKNNKTEKGRDASK